MEGFLLTSQPSSRPFFTATTTRHHDFHWLSSNKILLTHTSKRAKTLFSQHVLSLEVFYNVFWASKSKEIHLKHLGRRNTERKLGELGY